MKYRVKNWEKFQHYKNRNPPWIKLHKSIIDDHVFQSLPVASRALAPMIWLLASETKDGILDCNPSVIAFRLRTTERHIKEALKPLIDRGFLVNASTLLARCNLNATTETETETETEEIYRSFGPNGTQNSLRRRARFDRWWAEYPRKVAKAAAEKAWAKIDPDDASTDDLIAILKKQRRNWSDPKFIPHAATYLNGRRWEDVPDKHLGETYNSENPDEPLPF